MTLTPTHRSLTLDVISCSATPPAMVQARRGRLSGSCGRDLAAHPEQLRLVDPTGQEDQLCPRTP